MILMLLCEHPDRWWTADDVRRKLAIDLDSTIAASNIITKRIELRLSDLLTRGLVQHDGESGQYRYAADERQRRCLDHIVANRPDFLEASQLIYVKPMGSASAPVAITSTDSGEG